MGVKIREKPKGSGEWWIFINHHGNRKSKRVGDKETAQEVPNSNRSAVNRLDNIHPNAPYTHPAKAQKL
jgi:hypothetical protein